MAMGDFFVRMKSCKTSENTVKKMAKLILLFTFFKAVRWATLYAGPILASEPYVWHPWSTLMLLFYLKECYLMFSITANPSSSVFKLWYLERKLMFAIFDIILIHNLWPNHPKCTVLQPWSRVYITRKYISFIPSSITEWLSLIPACSFSFLLSSKTADLLKLVSCL